MVCCSGGFVCSADTLCRYPPKAYKPYVQNTKEGRTGRDLISLLQKTHPLLEGVRSHYASIVGSFHFTKGGEMTHRKRKDIWEEITQDGNAVESGQRMTMEQVESRWKMLKARATKEQQKTSIGQQALWER